MRIAWRAGAARQLREQLEFVRARNPRAADRLERRIEACVAQLMLFPLIGSASRAPGVRELVITRTPFIAVYQVAGDKVVILRFFHGRQQR
ncbi:MAG TPA: type II toxin-antitoxin system RelE/ParE family toxin [Terricaulis sp.]|nr:type II toxin-antitoxin system RelE/ParE family toxin [Terricaulis sp.]